MTNIKTALSVLCVVHLGLEVNAPPTLPELTTRDAPITLLGYKTFDDGDWSRLGRMVT